MSASRALPRPCLHAKRRELLLGALALSSGCRSATKESSPAKPTSASEITPLQVVKVGNMAESERGGTAVVLLHGWGAAGDDLVSLAQRLLQPRSRFFMPAGPLAQGPTGRAWWGNGADRPAAADDDKLPADHRPNLEVTNARRSVQKLLRDIRERYTPERLVVAGFSQGAMLTLDVALSADPPVDRAAALSGVLLMDSLPALLAPHAARPSFYVTHGSHDAMLPFAAGERAAQLLTKHGFSVSFRSFGGGHEMPREVVAGLRAFIYEG